MPNPVAPKLAKWPFVLGDALLLALAYFLCFQTKAPVEMWAMLACAAAVALGAALGVLPFLLEYRALVKLAEAEALTSVVAQIQEVEKVARQIGSATAQWQSVQEGADKTTAAAKGIADRITAEAQAFTQIMQNMNDSEKAALRLEVEKLRRVEGDWLQVIVRMLDHVFALHNAAVRSGRRDVTEQLTHFQSACHDVARRIGLTPFAPATAEVFDGARHQLLDSEPAPESGALIAETIATGYTYQGKLLRRALVRLQNGKVGAAAEDKKERDLLAPTGGSAQSQLPLAATEAPSAPQG